MSSLYPLKFKPILKERIWGGNKLRDLYGKTEVNEKLPVGESWELSSVEGDLSVVANGFLEGNNIKELIEIYMGDLVGDKVYEKFGDEFPLLIKLIDATSDLSVQVHPNDELAKERHHAWGKTEFWHILESEPDSYVISGFNKSISKQDYTDSLNAGNLSSMLRYQKVRKGDSIFIPAGLVHAIGKGIVLAEIQQTSDITYRIYDWNRVDEHGMSRDLHTELAVDAIDFKSQQDVIPATKFELDLPVQLVSNHLFSVNRIEFSKTMEISSFDSDTFRIYLCIEGNVSVEYSDNQHVGLKKGELVLVPAELYHFFLEPKEKSILLEIFIT